MAWEPPYNHNKPWTLYDDKCLKYLWSIERSDINTTLSDIADMLGRTVNAIRHRLCELGLWPGKLPTHSNRKRKYIGKWKKRKKE